MADNYFYEVLFDDMIQDVFFVELGCDIGEIAT